MGERGHEKQYKGCVLLDKKQKTKINKNNLLSESSKCNVHGIVSFDANSIPEKLKEYMQWVPWKLEQRYGRLIKVPYTVQGYEASILDPGTWTDFKTAYTVLNENSGTYQGLGFVLTENDPFIFFDQEELTSLNSYFENSKIDLVGYLILIKAIEKLKIRNGCVRIYSSGRYFVITGCTNSKPLTMNDISEPTIKSLYAKNDNIVFFGYFVYRGLNVCL